MAGMDMNELILTGTQTRLCRALIGWSVRQLAECAKVSDSTVKRIELCDGVREKTEHKILLGISKCLTSAISELGWELMDNGGIQPRGGVCMGVAG